jgi:hypothetical protein
MDDQQAGTNPPEKDDAISDARAAYAEVAGREAEVKAEPEVRTEPEVKAEPENAVELKANHPTDERRYADGTFKPTKEEVAAAKAETRPASEGAKPSPMAPAAPEPAPQAGAPPGGFSPKTKADWEKITAQFPHLAADIAKREKEVGDGFAQYEGMRELRPYVDLARSQGQTLKQALDRYTGIETSLRQKPLETLLYLAGNAGYPPQRLAMELAPYLGHSQAPQDQGAQPPIDPNMMQQWLNPLTQKLTTLESQVQQFQQADQQRYQTAYSAAQNRFTADPAHKFFENVRPQMAQLFAGGFIQETGDVYADLKAAYDMACNMNPEIRELLLNERMAKDEAQRRKTEQEAAERARQASRSITGSPSSTVRETDDSKGGSPFDDARRAYREVGARV